MNPSTTVELNNLNLNNYTRYIEVIIGEGQSLLHLNPKIKCFLNDPNTDLINFYKYISEPELKYELDAFSSNWELMGTFSNFCFNEISVMIFPLSLVNSP